VVISRFEDIESWQRARDLAAGVYGLSTQGAFRKDFGLRDQIQRACVSIMANIAEGFGRSGATEFIRYLTIAHASTTEVQSHLYVALDLQYITRSDFDRLYGSAESVRKLIGGFIGYLGNQKLGTRN
jgi:four helix bundle protein